MRCERYEQDLTVGAAGGAITPDLEAHLEGCAACRERLAEKQALLGHIDQVLTSHLDVEPSAGLGRRVIARVAEAERARRRMARWAAAAALAAGLAMVLWGGRLARRPSATLLPSSVAAIVPTEATGGTVKPETRALAPSTPRERVAATPRVVRTRSSPPAGRLAAAPEPEVLVPAGQEEALRRFVASLREDAGTPRPLLRATATVESPIAPPPLIQIPVLASEPLSDPADPLERSKS
jgi:hypothetical protein